jgi:geranylgeranyl diphosphate synthase type I
MGDDLKEGKLSLVLIHALRSASPSDAKRIREVITADSVDKQSVRTLLSLCESTNSIEYAREVAAELSANAVTCLDGLGLTPEVQSSLEQFSRFVVERDV